MCVCVCVCVVVVVVVVVSFFLSFFVVRYKVVVDCFLFLFRPKFRPDIKHVQLFSYTSWSRPAGTQRKAVHYFMH